MGSIDLTVPRNIDWLNSAMIGQSLQLCCPCPLPLNTPISAGSRINAMYHINNDVTQLRITPDKPNEAAKAFVICLENVLFVGPATDFMLFFSSSEKQLGQEMERGVVIQYVTHDAQRCRVCFFTETVEETKLFINLFSLLCFSKPVGDRRTMIV